MCLNIILILEVSGVNMSQYAFCRIFLFLSFYDNPSTLIHIGFFFYIRHNIFHSLVLACTFLSS